jgi:hypothetical protein
MDSNIFNREKYTKSFIPLISEEGGLFHREMYINDISDIEYISDVTVPMPGGSHTFEITKPLHYFKSNSDYSKFLDELQENYKNPYTQKEIKNGFITGDFDTKHMIKGLRRKTRKIRRAK